MNTIPAQSDNTIYHFESILQEDIPQLPNVVVMKILGQSFVILLLLPLPVNAVFFNSPAALPAITGS